MTEQLPKNIENQIDEIWFKTQKRLIEEKLTAVEESIGGNFTIEELITKVEDFNSIIDSTSGYDEELYDMYRFRMFVKGTEVILLQRPKIVSEIDQMYIVGKEMYNLCDYEEIDVDVRRYGKGPEPKI